jgi:ketosteroid isomerase-like protein
MRILFTLVIASLITVSACSPTESTLTYQQKKELSEEVNLAFEGLADAVKTLNHTQYFSYFDKDNYTALNPDGTVLHSFDAFKKMYLPQTVYIQDYQNLTFNNVKIDIIDPNTAVLVNEYTAEIALKSGDTIKASGAGTQVWSKRTGAWKLVNVSSSVKP